MKKLKLIYILGFGHSGTTLLDLILGAQQDVESVGELIRLKKELDWKISRCTCGELFTSCEHWEKILSKYKENMKRENLNGMSKDIYNIYSPLYNKSTKRLFSTIFTLGKSKLDNDGINKYGLQMYQLYSSILESTNSDIIVDSSKNHRQIIYLFLSGFFNLKIIYIYRDGKELINSYKMRSINLYNDVLKIFGEENLDDWYKEMLKEKNKDQIRKKDIAKSIINFIISHYNKQKSIKYLIKSGLNNDEIFLLNYKELATYPQKILRNLSKHIGFSFKENTIDFGSDSYFQKRMGHNLGGNIFKAKAIKPIQYNDNWKRNLSCSDKFLFYLFFGEIMDWRFRKYKYGIKL